MSDITKEYLLRARSRAENQYGSLRRALGIVLQHQGWKVEQITEFHSGRSVVKREGPQEKPKFFQVPEASIDSIGSKLAMRIFDEYANILKCMYSTRFNGVSVIDTYIYVCVYVCLHIHLLYMYTHMDLCYLYIYGYR